MKVLVLNCGSSSLKFQLVELSASGSGRREHKLARGLIERIGAESICTFAAAGSEPEREALAIRDHEEGLKKALAWLEANLGSVVQGIDGVGHRVVHGGERFTSSVLIDEEVMAAVEGLIDLAPLHNPACLSGIRAARRFLGPTMPMVAAFDTEFHHAMPDYASIYAIPYDLSLRHKIRRYGFHGLAHRHAALRFGEITATPGDQIKIITLHLGNGCSATAIRAGKSVDTSMGFTPLEGLVMGTRSGDLDPALIGYLAEKESVSAGEVEGWLNRRSGLLGVSGRSRDMREIEAHMKEDARARLAFEIFCYRARKYLGAYLAALGGAQAVVFSGGIGENSPPVRARICAGMEWCGLKLDPERNGEVAGREERISAAGSGIEAYVIPTDEELLIARDTARLILGRAGG